VFEHAGEGQYQEIERDLFAKAPEIHKLEILADKQPR
jgi:hypothetical protein